MSVKPFSFSCPPTWYGDVVAELCATYARSMFKGSVVNVRVVHEDEEEDHQAVVTCQVEETQAQELRHAMQGIVYGFDSSKEPSVSDPS